MTSRRPLPLVLGLAALALVPGCRRESRRVVVDDGTITVRVDEHLVFTPNRLSCRAGEPLRIRLMNTIPPGGPEVSHNFVLLREGADVDAFAAAGVDARPDNNFIPPAFADRVISSSPLVAPGRTLEIMLVAPRTPGDYPLVCAFPGHCVLGMRGVLTVR